MFAGRERRHPDVLLHETAGQHSLQHHRPRGVLGEEHPLQTGGGGGGHSVSRAGLEKCQDCLRYEGSRLLSDVFHQQRAEDGARGGDTADLLLYI